MPHPTALRELATLIEAINDGNLTVTNVQTPNQQLIADQTLTVELTTTLQVDTPSEAAGELSVSLQDTTTETTLADGVTIPLEVTIGASNHPTPAEQSTNEVEAPVTDGGVAVAATTETAPTSTGETTATSNPADDTADKAGDQATGAAESPPPHRDPDRLQEVYDPSKTFAEMTDALDVDVTPQTVRHHMIKQGIHEPNGQTESDTTTATADTVASPDADQTPPVDEADSDTATTTDEDTPAESTADTQSADETDQDTTETQASPVTEDDLPAAVTLPSHLTVAELTQAVAEAQTLYEVQRDLRLDRSTARQLLRDLDILDFVGGRVTTAEDQQITQADVMDRLREHHS